MKIVVTGASGLLGTTLTPFLKLNGHEVVSVGRSPDSDVICDLTDLHATRSVLDKLLPDTILNLVALTNIEKCEKNPNLAYLVKCRVVENIADWTRSSKVECHLFQISTDQIYDGSGPHGEDNVTLTNYYAFSKFSSELAAGNIKSTILRTNFFGKSANQERKSFTDWLLKSATLKENFVLFDDVFFSPLSMTTLSEIFLKLITQRPIGIFNLGSRRGLSKADFAKSFLNLSGFDISNVNSISIDEAPFIEVYRPKDMRMNISKIENLLNTAPSLETEIRRVVGEYYERSRKDY